MAYMSDPTAVMYRARSVFSSPSFLKHMTTFEQSGDLINLQSSIPNRLSTVLMYCFWLR